MRISVYITSYNQAGYLREAIDSVLAQSVRPFEIIVVDDCSTDDSRALISSYERVYPDLVRGVFHENNTGVAQTRVDALNAVSGDYVTYLDGDDRYLPQKLEKEASILSEVNSADIAFSNVYYINRTGERIGEWCRRGRPPEGEVFVPVFARDFPGGSLFRCELVNYRAWKKIGFYDPSLSTHEDYDMRIRLSKHLRTVYVNEPLSEYRKHNASLRQTDIRKKVNNLERIWQKNCHLLRDLPPVEQDYVRRRLDEWRARFWRWKAKELLGAWSDDVEVDRRRAWEAYRTSLDFHRTADPDLLLGFLLPHGIYRMIRDTAVELRRRVG